MLHDFERIPQRWTLIWTFWINQTHARLKAMEVHNFDKLTVSGENILYWVSIVIICAHDFTIRYSVVHSYEYTDLEHNAYNVGT